MRTITINSRRLGRYDNASPYLVENGELQLRIPLPAITGEFFFCGELNGVPFTPIPIKGIISVPVCAGELRSEVKHYVDGELVETYLIEGLILKQVDKELASYSELTELRKKIADVQRAVDKETRERAVALCADKTAITNALTAEVKKLAVAFFSFAYQEYLSDLQLNSKSLTLADFLSAFGYAETDFTEEELDTIKQEAEL